MLYDVDFTVEVINIATNKLKTTLKVTNGIIHYLGVSFPPGCANLVKTTINYGLHQIFPTNPDGQIKGDNISVEGKVFQPILEPPYEVDIHAWNVGAIHPHTVTVRLWLLKVWQLMPFSDEMYMLSLKQSVGSL